MTREEKIQVLINTGFKQCKNKTEYEMQLKRGNDRFATAIFYDSESEQFYYARYKLSGFREVTKADIMNNHNELHTTSKEHFIEIEEILKKSGIVLL